MKIDTLLRFDLDQMYFNLSSDSIAAHERGMIHSTGLSFAA